MMMPRSTGEKEQKEEVDRKRGGKKRMETEKAGGRRDARVKAASVEHESKRSMNERSGGER